MSNYEINNLDPDDIGLQQVMGNRFQNGTKQSGRFLRAEEGTESTQEEKKAQKPMDAQWEPSKERNWMDDLKDCAKSSLLFGGLNMLIWYWEVSGLMDESVAMPCMLACAAMFGLGIGKCCRRGNR